MKKLQRQLKNHCFFVPLALVACVFYSAWICAFSTNDRDIAVMVATQQIEYLRRHYARATDLIGLNTEEGIEEGRGVYRRIFTADAKICVSENGQTVFTAEGPDAWVDVADEALSVFDNTQHLIGTQLVTIERLPDDSGVGGLATMTSYLQAWHDDSDRVLDIFIGTYHDKLRFVPGIGWQIYEMELEKVSGSVLEKTAVQQQAGEK